jgi:hypothetical protein
MAVKPGPGNATPAMTREQLLGARRTSERQWQVETAGGSVRLVPFISVGDLPYTTYLKVG